MIKDNITFPNNDQILDPVTGRLAPEWQRFFQDIYDLLNAATKDGGKVGFLGATPAIQQPAPVVLADVINVLQTFGFTS